MVRFDDSLPTFASLVTQYLGPEALRDNLFLRDISGKLTFILLALSPTDDRKALLMLQAEQELGAYVDKDGFCVSTPDQLFDDSLKTLDSARQVSILHPKFDGQVWLVDRRFVGADWLRPVELPAKGPARFVFASMKGGVGRSTALCVLASHLASSGQRVLCIDLDMESPGLGNMLLTPETIPRFGLLDFFAEQLANPLDEAFYVDMVGSSWLTGQTGRLDVIPALGRSSIEFPENVLSKLARAYLAGADSNAGGQTFADHLCCVVSRFSEDTRYDAILVDARAGLHETTAAALTGLGAEILLFGIDEPQTFAAFELLFASLASGRGMVDGEWREHLQIVQAKAPPIAKKRTAFSDRVEELQRKYFWPSPSPPSAVPDLVGLSQTFEVEWTKENENEEAVESMLQEPDLSCIAILEDERFHGFDPVSNGDVLSDALYDSSFRAFLLTAKRSLPGDQS